MARIRADADVVGVVCAVGTPPVPREQDLRIVRDAGRRLLLSREDAVHLEAPVPARRAGHVVVPAVSARHQVRRRPGKLRRRPAGGIVVRRALENAAD